MTGYDDTSLVTAMTECNLAEESLHNQKSPLLKLPAELRNKIYESVFSGHVISMPASVKTASHMRANKKASVKTAVHVRVYKEENSLNEHASLQPNLLALTETCGQIYHEANLLPLKLCEVGINTYSDAEFAGINAFLNYLSDEKRAAITKMVVKSSLRKVHDYTYADIFEMMDMDPDDFDFETGCWKEKHYDSEKPLINLLARFDGLKSVRVIGVRDSVGAELGFVAVKKDPMKDCKAVGKWLKSLMKGREVEVIVDCKIDGM